MQLNRHLIKEILSDNYDISLIEDDGNENFFMNFIVAENFEVELKDGENIIDKVFLLFPPDDWNNLMEEYHWKIVIDLISKNNSNANRKNIDNIVIYDSSIIKEIRENRGNSVKAKKPSFFKNNKYKFKYFAFGGCYSGKYRAYIYREVLEQYAEELDIELNDNITFDNLHELFRIIVSERYEWNYYDYYSDDDYIYYILKD